jgi:hypothetical protein
MVSMPSAAVLAEAAAVMAAAADMLCVMIFIFRFAEDLLALGIVLCYLSSVRFRCLLILRSFVRFSSYASLVNSRPSRARVLLFLFSIICFLSRRVLFVLSSCSTPRPTKQRIGRFTILTVRQYNSAVCSVQGTVL